MATGSAKPTFIPTNDGSVTNLNGLIIQRWSIAGFAYNTQTTVNFPTAFPTKCLCVLAYNIQLGFDACQSISGHVLSKTQCKLYQKNDHSPEVACNIMVIAIGY